MKHKSRRIYGLVLSLLLLASCQWIPSGSVEPLSTEEPTAGAVTSPNCEAIAEQIVVLGIADRINESLPSMGVSPDDILETVSLADLDAEEFDALYLIQTQDAISLTQQLRDAGFSTSLNYKTHLFGHSGGDSPFGRSPHPALTPPADGIRGHAALSETLQIHLADQEVPMESEIVVGVFDTAPFTVSNAAELADVLLTSTGPVDWYDGSPPGVSRDHGLFVASLIGAVAPNAEVYLYRVLEDTGEGATMTILKQVASFLTEYPPSREEPRILNFSLGIWCHPPLLGYQEETPEEFAALDDLLNWASGRGAVIVAAAGNNANRYESYILGSEYPASASFAIGVGSTNKGGVITCYSHDAFVYAPGGDGIETTATPAPSDPPIPPSATKFCAPNHTACTDESCDYGLLSLSAESPSDYAYWSGTSFAAPLVSGLAARLLANDPTHPTPIADRILNCAPLNTEGQHILGSIVGC